MASILGKNVDVLVDEFDLTSYFNDSTVAKTAAVAEDTAYGDDSQTFIAGLRTHTISLSGFFDSASDGSDEELQALVGVANVVTLCPEGHQTIGNPAFLGEQLETSYQASAPVGDVVSISAEMQGTGDTGNWGKVLHILTAEGSSTDNTTVDDGSPTTNGAVAILHMTANAHDNTTDIEVQHSTNDSTWTTLASFTQIAATTKTSEVQRTADGGNVYRYVRTSSTLAGSGNVTYEVSLARK
jgi:hypothetical protein|tara:strand:+ start:3437 stop:4159 length:723 start_codon:yes stop_codon:yes gene_type:complete